jgi:nucleoside-diphosphate-sugar epimerase
MNNDSLAGKTMSITGVGGFIGLRMAERATERGMRVRGLDASAIAADLARSRGVDVVTGDVTDAEAVARASRGADVMFHTAAVVGEDGDMALYRRVNVEGTRTVAEVGRAAGVRQFVHLSSVMVYGFTYPPFVAEDGPFRGEGNPYCETKLESDRLALGLHAKGAFDVTVIRPGDVYGPRSHPWVLRPLDLMRKRLFVLIDGGRGTMNHVHVDNLLDVVFAALERRAAGEAFNVTDGASTTFADYFGRLAHMLGRKWLPSAPGSMVRSGFSLAGRVGARLGFALPVSPAAVDFVSRLHPYGIDRARRVLEYEPRISLDQGMAEVEIALRAAGQIP